MPWINSSSNKCLPRNVSLLRFSVWRFQRGVWELRKHLAASLSGAPARYRSLAGVWVAVRAPFRPVSPPASAQEQSLQSSQPMYLLLDKCLLLDFNVSLSSMLSASSWLQFPVFPLAGDASTGHVFRGGHPRAERFVIWVFSWSQSSSGSRRSWWAVSFSPSLQSPCQNLLHLLLLEVMFLPCCLLPWAGQAVILFGDLSARVRCLPDPCAAFSFC